MRPICSRGSIEHNPIEAYQIEVNHRNRVEACEEKAEGRKPAQPSIPEGILGFLPSDPNMLRTRFAKIKTLKTKYFTTTPKVKTPGTTVKFVGAPGLGSNLSRFRPGESNSPPTSR